MTVVRSTNPVAISVALVLLLNPALSMGGPVVTAEQLAGKSVGQQCQLLTSRGGWVEARPLCEQAAAQGDFGAMLSLEWIKLTHRPLYPEALALAKGGNADAASYLGAALLLGQVAETVAPSDQALHWLQLAADNGNAEGHYWLGVAYSYGKFPGAEADLVAAAGHLQQAAERGHDAAALLLAELHLYRQFGQPADALPWLRQGQPTPEGSNWGWVYEHGIGVPVDLLKAEAIYHQSSDTLGAFRATQLMRLRPHSSEELQQAAQRLEGMALLDDPAPWLTAKPTVNGDSCRLLAGLYASGQSKPTRSADIAAEVTRWYGYAAFYDQKGRAAP